MTVNQLQDPSAPITPESLRATSFDAVITDEEFQEIAATRDSMTPNFRAGVMMLARSSDSLMNTAQDDLSAAFDLNMKLVEYIQSGIETAKGEIELLEQAEARAMVMCAKLVPEADLLNDKEGAE